MKQSKYLPIWMLYARSTLPALLAILVLTAGLEAFLFRLNWNGAVSLDGVFQNSRLSLVMALSLILWTLVLSLPGWNRAAHTLNRLPSDRFTQSLCHVGFNALSYLLLWGFHICLLYTLFLWFGAQASPEIFGPQSMLLLFYRSDPLHALLPLNDWSLWCKVLAYLLCLSVVADYPMLQRKKSLSKYIVTIVLFMILLLSFPTGLTNMLENLVSAAIAPLVALILLFWHQTDSFLNLEVEENET